jgi:hypothetical protein
MANPANQHLFADGICENHNRPMDLGGSDHRGPEDGNNSFVFSKALIDIQTSAAAWHQTNQK